MNSNPAGKIALEDLNAEAEADALLAEDEAAHNKFRGERDLSLEDLEASESLPPPIQAISAVRLHPVPAPVQARALTRTTHDDAQEKKPIHPAPIICIWIFLSSSVIVMNAWILKDLNFP